MARLFNAYIPTRKLVLASSDAALIISGLLVASLLWSPSGVKVASVDSWRIFKIGVAFAALMLCMYYYDLYESNVLVDLREFVTRLSQVVGTACVVLALVYYAYPPVQIGAGVLLFALFVIGVLLLIRRTLFLAINRSPRLAERAVLVGYGPLAISLAKEVEKRPELGVQVVGYADEPPRLAENRNGLRRAGGLCDLAAIVEKEGADRVIVTMNDRRGRLPIETLLRLKGRGFKVEDGLDFFERATGKVFLEALQPSWLVFSPGFQASKRTLFYKRALSILLASLTLVICSPLLVAIAVAIRLDSPGPVIFRQKRVGKGGKLFTLCKFRSMHVGSDSDGLAPPAQPNDPRVTRVGRWLRRTRLDELPQLLNILRGDIYFVGPRPFAAAQEEELSQKIPFYPHRWTVKPGATGWAQVHRPYCATLGDNAEKLGYDLFYIKNMSLGLDLLILFHTVKILLLGRGAR